MEMTPESRAENIFTLLNLPAKHDPNNGISKSNYDAVLAEIREAIEEALEKQKRDLAPYVSDSVVDAYREGKTDAYEDAARICLCGHDCGREASERILLKAKEL